MLQKGQFRRTSELPVAIIWSPVIHFCPDRIIIERQRLPESPEGAVVSAKFHTPC